MPKTDLKKIFKNGENFQFKPIDYSQPANANRLDKIKKEQDAILKRTDVDWKKLENVVIKM